MVTQRDVAKLAGVSCATASKYINKVGYINFNFEIKIELEIFKDYDYSFKIY